MSPTHIRDDKLSSVRACCLHGLCGIIGFLSTLATARAQVPDAQESPDKGLIAARNSTRLRRQIRDILRSAEDAELGALRSSEDDVLAVAAAWEVIRRPIVPNPNPDFPGALRQVDLPVEGLHRFVGFLEGRLRVQPPKWWTESLVHTQAYTQSVMKVWFPDDSSIYHNSEEGICCPSDLTVTNKSGRMWLSQNSKTVPVPSSVFEEVGGFDSIVRVTACITESEFYFASLPFHGPYYVYRVDEERVSWKTRVFVDYPHFGGGTGPPTPHWSTIQLNNGRVWVFGAHDYGLYAESFDAADGTPLFRLSTTY